MAKPIIAVDIDDVLAASAEGWVAFSNQRFGTKLKPEDYDEDWAKMWQVDHETHLDYARQVYESKVFKRFEPDTAALPVLQRLSHRYTLVIASSRVGRIRAETLEWLGRYYTGIFKDIHLTGLYDTLTEHSYKGTKAALVAEIKADYLIDDQLKHCLAVAEKGIPALLFGDYKWNHSSDVLPPNVTRCYDWEAVEDYFAREN